MLGNFLFISLLCNFLSFPWNLDDICMLVLIVGILSLEDVIKSALVYLVPEYLPFTYVVEAFLPVHLDFGTSVQNIFQIQRH